MDTGTYIEVTDRDGWHKEFPLAGRIAFIGSGPNDNVLLDPGHGGRVVERHLQIILPEDNSPQFQVVNFGAEPVERDRDRPIPPWEPGYLTDGDCLRLGDFRLVFHLGSTGRAFAPPGTGRMAPPAPATPERSSACIGLSLALDDLALCLDRRLEGVAVLQNLGGKQGVQFRLDLAGLPAGSYSIGPAPILYPNGEGKVRVSLSHPRGPALPAGPCRIVVSASAPDAYPGEAASAAQVIEIEPYYSHSLRVR